MAVGEIIRRFGPPSGAPGIEVLEQPGGNAISDPRYGSVFLLGALKRGPMGVAVPVSSRREYDSIYSDPKDPTWHLFPNGAHLLPDAIDGFFSNGGGTGRAYVLRLPLDGKARKASVVLKNRGGADALKITAGNEGRWGGRKNDVSLTPIIFATSRTFTLVSPGVEANEFVDAYAEFSNSPGKKYKLVANTAAAESGETVYTIGAQYDLIADGVSGPVSLSGSVAYERYPNLTGTIAFPLFNDLVGTSTINGRVVTGVSTTYTEELKVGDSLYYQGEARVVDSITSDTTLTVEEEFSSNGSGLTLQRDNLVVAGTGTRFTTELKPGDTIYATSGGFRHARTVAAIASATSLTLSSGWTFPMTAGSGASYDGVLITGTTTAFVSELQVGSFLVDPSRAGQTVKVVQVISATSAKVEKPFPGGSFSGVQLTKQAQYGSVVLDPIANQGLTVDVGMGIRYPQTHFSLTVRLNGSTVMSLSDCSLDPNDELGLFVDTLVNSNNIAYRQGSTNYSSYIDCETLWTSTYTTAKGSDVRPCNGGGTIVALEAQKAYTVAEFDYNLAKGTLFYPNPYEYARGYFRVKDAQAPIVLEGTISSLGTAVTGVGTTFTSTFKRGDYLYDPRTKTARKIRFISNDLSLTLETAFPSNMPALTKGIKAGWLSVDPTYSLNQFAQVQDDFIVVYPTSLEKGYDGDLARLLPYYFTRFADVDTNIIENSVWGQNLGLVRIAIPGISDSGVQKAFTYYASEKAFEYRCEIPSYYNTAATAESWVNNILGRNDFQSVAFPSYGYISNPLGSGDRLISITGDIFGGESERAVASEGYHTPFAGMRATLPRIIKLPLESLPSDEAILNVAGIQPIKTLFGNVVVYGARVPSLSPTYDFLHIRRIQSNYIRFFLEARVLLELIFLPNSPELAERVTMIMNNFGRREYKKGVFARQLTFRQAVEISTSGGDNASVANDNTADAIVALINGRLEVYFRYVPTGILERLSIHAGPDILVARYGSVIADSTNV